MTTVLIVLICAVFGVAALMTVWRIIIGPSILDRAVASDVLLTLLICALGAEMAVNHHTRTLPVLLIVAAVGVFGSVSIARFVARRDSEVDR
ncbi:monovalent cation/H+ antiporter complex subunit F [Microbacterium oleivorans]|uniref:monovalent cation/H+ antiporter complex subunit F n=1 Tax=Microbacterium oleivorans TaxID=273677 RepID=UPI00080EAF8B|nr:monovalent cation/H+ antiporter complex subunit F [Microbacterium oleivorans]